jgi:hypothetical protein
MMNRITIAAFVVYALGLVGKSCACQPLPANAVLRFHNTRGDKAALQFLRSSGVNWSVTEDFLDAARKAKISTDRLGPDFRTALEALLSMTREPESPSYTYRVVSGIWMIGPKYDPPFHAGLPEIDVKPAKISRNVSMSLTGCSQGEAVSQLSRAANVDYVLVHQPESHQVFANLTSCPFESAVKKACPGAVLFWLQTADANSIQVQGIGNREGRSSLLTDDISIETFRADLRYVLKALFAVPNINYVLDQGVQGRITLALKHVKWKEAFEAVLRSATDQLTYRVEGGVYVVVPKV